MTITVKRLIAKLEEIENKHLEVEVAFAGRFAVPIDSVYKSNKKVVIEALSARDERE